MVEGSARDEERQRKHRKRFELRRQEREEAVELRQVRQGFRRPQSDSGEHTTGRLPLVEILRRRSREGAEQARYSSRRRHRRRCRCRRRRRSGRRGGGEADQPRERRRLLQ